MEKKEIYRYFCCFGVGVCNNMETNNLDPGSPRHHWSDWSMNTFTTIPYPARNDCNLFGEETLELIHKLILNPSRSIPTRGFNSFITLTSTSNTGCSRTLYTQPPFCGECYDKLKFSFITQTLVTRKI